MKIVARLVLATLLLGGTAAHATLIKLTYSGIDLLLQPLPSFADPDFYADIFPAFAGEVILDESVFGGSVANKTISFSAIESFFGPTELVPGVVSWTHTAPLYSTAGTEVRFTFDGSKNLVSWLINALDGPPDFYSTPAGDQVFVGAADYAGAGGTWTTQVIPLPASGLLLCGAALGLIALGRRRAVH